MNNQNNSAKIYYKLYRFSLYAAFILGAIIIYFNLPGNQDYQVNNACWKLKHPDSQHDVQELSEKEKKICQNQSHFVQKYFARDISPGLLHSYQRIILMAIGLFVLFLPAYLFRRKYKKLNMS